MDDTVPIPTISIIIPVRNEEKNIVNLLDTLNRQSLQPQQVIIVDDESTDHTVEVASKYNVEIKIKNQTQNEEELVGKTAACYRGGNRRNRGVDDIYGR
ncbi:glycosyltransferase [Marinilactibacillus psychrotolerans]|uniref:glycosyltransferase n=1 Tax=Marinilactibacillus psychrotolerans TaxID=191770 RepID=UPI0037FA47E2